MNEGWRENFIMPESNVSPSAASNTDLGDIMLGIDEQNNDVKYNRPGLFAFMFPTLYPNCKGHYALMSTFSPDLMELDESQGGPTFANLREGLHLAETLKGYVKQRISMADRRFGSNSQFLFFMLDCVEKHNIASANRRVVNVIGNQRLRKRDIVQDDHYKPRVSSFVPHTIRSSQAYKKRQSQGLQTMFKKFGTPQLFMTFSCNDFDPHYLEACRGKRPWEDPFLFASYFKRLFNRFFNNHLLASAGFGRLVDEIREWSWVLDIQARGSPHIHLILCTGKKKIKFSIY